MMRSFAGFSINATNGEISRRTLLKTAVGGASALALGLPLLAGAGSLERPVIRQITHGPKFHWFGYYDKLQFDPTSRYVLGMEAAFENRSPRPDDLIKVGMVDLRDGDKWIELGETRAWCWQQGCMLQWLPGSDREIIWNDREDGHFVCHILDVKSRRQRTLPHPVYALSPDAQWAIAPSFSRLADQRPGYGYAGVEDPYRAEIAPKDTGIFHIDLRTGNQELLISVADVARIPWPGQDLTINKQWFNHLLVNPEGTRFVFLHRLHAKNGDLISRMMSAKADGSDLRVLIGSGGVSHFIWRDAAHVLAYSKPAADRDWGFFLYEDKTGGKVEEIGAGILKGDGHCNYLPDKRWILNDTYPDPKGLLHLHLFDTRKKRRVDLGDFKLPDRYYGEWRVDLHPRFSPNGRLITIDSPYTGQGRQIHLLDVSNVVTRS